MMNYKPRILILTLNSGEMEFDSCRASVAAQTGVSIDQAVYAGLGNREGHKAIYSEIMRRAREFDLFVKLDADMVLNRPTALRDVHRFFRDHPGLDHLCALVNDHFTGHPIPGVHVFSPRVRWDIRSIDDLFVDPDPEHPGPGIFNPPDLPIFVEHAPNPGRFQAFHFGYHRALKAFQRAQANPSLPQKVYQLGILNSLELQFRRTRRPELAFAVVGADLVARGKLGGASGDKTSRDVEAAFAQLASLDDAAIVSKALAGQPVRRFRIRALRRLHLIRRRTRGSVARGKEWVKLLRPKETIL
jgi:hypothetical protein